MLQCGPHGMLVPARVAVDGRFPKGKPEGRYQHHRYITPARPYGAGLSISHVPLVRRTFVYLEIQTGPHNPTHCGHTPIFHKLRNTCHFATNLKFRNQIQPLLPPTEPENSQAILETHNFFRSSRPGNRFNLYNIHIFNLLHQDHSCHSNSLSPESPILSHPLPPSSCEYFPASISIAILQFSIRYPPIN